MKKPFPKYPSLWHLKDLIESCQTTKYINGKWVPARPLGMLTLWSRFKYAWMVFTGRADAVIWPEGQ